MTSRPALAAATPARASNDDPRPVALAAKLAVLIAFAGLVALCAVFAVANIEVPTWAILVGRWIPALASLIALAVVGQCTVAKTWLLRTSVGGIAKSFGLALAVMVPVLAIPVLIAVFLGADTLPVGDLLMALPLLLLGPILFGLSTLGEEVLWRGHLTTALRRWGFWPMALTIGVIWMAWHVPLHALMWHQGMLTATEAITSTFGILVWSPLLTAMVLRTGTVWPAVFAHALPASALNFLSEVSRGDSVYYWTTLIGSWVVMLLAAALLTRGQRPAGNPPRAVTNPPSTAIA